MGVRENSISTCGCKDADARSDECCLWGGGAVMFRRTSRNEEVALQDILPFFVLLGLFIRFVLRPKEGVREQKGKWKRIGTRDIHIFPAEYGAAFAAVDVSHGVVACSHLTVIRFAFDNVNPAHVHPLASTRHDRASIRSYTSSNK